MTMANNQLNWSHFKPDFLGKPEEDAEAHLLRTNDWMTTHDIPNDQMVRIIVGPMIETTTERVVGTIIGEL